MPDDSNAAWDTWDLAATAYDQYESSVRKAQAEWQKQHGNTLNMAEWHAYAVAQGYDKEMLRLRKARTSARIAYEKVMVEERKALDAKRRE